MTRTLVATILFLFSLTANAVAMSELLSKKSQFEAVLISPTGEYLAVAMVRDEKRLIGIISRETMQFTATINLQKEEMPGEFLWVNNDRLATKILYVKEKNALPTWYGNWFAMNADGSKKKVITSQLKNLGVNDIGWPEIIDVMPNDPKSVLVLNRKKLGKDGDFTTVLKLNVYNGSVRREARLPLRDGYALTDNNSAVRFALGADSSDENTFKIYHRPEKNTDWQLLNEYGHLKAKLRPISFVSEDEVYLVGSVDSNTTSLYRYNLKTKSSELVFNAGNVDLTDVVISNDKLLAVRTDDGLPKLKFIDTKNVISRWLFSLQDHFPGEFISAESATRDERYFVIRVYSDVKPTEFYLVDTVKGKVDFLLSSKPWIKPSEMSPMQPISFEARDGLKVSGYITLPKEKKEKIPLVVLPHGGPHGIRDYWGFQEEVQYLASLGVAVLQVNYRGSAGYGNAFSFAGVGNWWSTMVEDIIDATQWASNEFAINKNEVCISGGSYGAYAALMSATKAADMFKCVIAASGVYDLALHLEISDTSNSSLGQNYLKDVLGNNKNALKANSPIANIDKLKAPVLIIHGEHDRRTPLEQAQLLKSKLDEMKHPYQWQLFENEGHGLYKEKSRQAYFDVVKEFLKEHLTISGN